MSDPGFDLSGRRALVTGASKGIGAAIARRLAGAGARVVALSRSGDIATSGRGIEPLRVDLGDPGALDGTIDAAVEILGGLDILVNNAGLGL